MPEPIITHHISPYHAVQGTATEVEKIAAARIAHIRHVYGDADPDAALIEQLRAEVARLTAERNAALAEKSDTLRQVREALECARDLAMRMAVVARVPECRCLGAIAQDISAALSLLTKE